MMGLLPLLSAALVGQQLAAPSSQAAAYALSRPPSTPSRHVRTPPPPSSPMPPHAEELRHFLEALRIKKGIDLRESEHQLALLEYTPDILPDVPLDRLKEVTGAVDGRVLKLQAFAREWNERQAQKRRAQA